MTNADGWALATRYGTTLLIVRDYHEAHARLRLHSFTRDERKRAVLLAPMREVRRGVWEAR